MNNPTGQEPKSISNAVPKGKTGKVVLIIVVCLIVVFIIFALLGMIVYLLYKINKQSSTSVTSVPDSSTPKSYTITPTAAPTVTFSPTSSPLPTPTSTTKIGWQRYKNARYGFNLEIPSTLTKEESANGDGATFTTYDPPMTVRVWAENNSLKLTAQEAIDFDKEDMAKNEVENLEVIEEEKITINGESAVKSVWSYSAPSTGDAITTSRAYVTKGENIYKIEFLIDTAAWAEYSEMFEEIIASLEFR